MSKQFENEFRASVGIKDKIVYHYCSLDSLYGIIASKSLWLTSLQSSNDKKELAVSKYALDDFLKKAIEKQQDNNKKEILRNLLNAPYDKEYRKNKQSIKYYGLSCVEQKDSLTHWDRYGNQGNGVCIAINLAILDNYFDVSLYGNIFRSWLVHDKILYKESDQEQLISYLLEDKIRAVLEKSNLEALPHIHAIIYYSVLNQIKPLFKHDGFYDESEYRIIFQERQGEDEAEYYKKIAISDKENEELFQNVSNIMMKVLAEVRLLYKDKKYNKIGNMIRGYYTLNLEEIWSDTLIPEIILGPKCFQDKLELKGFLQKNELWEAKISVSKIPVR
jgi:Protein of unknown function (DUF2971).